MTPRLVLADAASAADALTFAGRATQVADEGVRLQADAGVLVMTAAVLSPRALMDATPTVLALRVLAADPQLRCDLVVAELQQTDDPVALSLPETALSPSWAGVAPPRGGWRGTGSVAAATLAARAQWGIAAVAETTPVDAGEDAVRAVRAGIWGQLDDELDGLPLGVAFAAFAFGFIGGEEEAGVSVSDRWTRITLRRGHVLSRGPVRTGMTTVRRTRAAESGR